MNSPTISSSDLDRIPLWAIQDCEVLKLVIRDDVALVLTREENGVLSLMKLNLAPESFYLETQPLDPCDPETLSEADSIFNAENPLSAFIEFRQSISTITQL